MDQQDEMLSAHASALLQKCPEAACRPCCWGAVQWLDVQYPSSGLARCGPALSLMKPTPCPEADVVHQHLWGCGLAHARHCITSCARARCPSQETGNTCMWTPTQLLPPLTSGTPDKVSPRWAGPPSHEGLQESQSCSLGIVPQPATAAALSPGCPCHLDRECHPTLLILSSEPSSWSNSLWSWRAAGDGAA